MRADALASLETDRLVLRPLVTDDDGALHALFCDPFVYRFLFDGRAPDPSTSAAIFAACREAALERGFAFHPLRLRGTEAIVGFAGLRPEEDTGEAELVYGLAPAYASRGLATEAAAACLRHGFESLGLPRIFASADATNLPSLAVLARLGMRRVGSRPGAFGEVHRYARRADDPSEAPLLQPRPRSADPLG